MYKCSGWAGGKHAYIKSALAWRKDHSILLSKQLLLKIKVLYLLYILRKLRNEYRFPVLQIFPWFRIAAKIQLISYTTHI